MFWIFGGLEFGLSSDELLGSIQGLPIAGQFVKYGRWLLMQPVQEAKPVKQLLVRAWEFKTEITLDLKGTKLSDGRIQDKDHIGPQRHQALGWFQKDYTCQEDLGTNVRGSRGRPSSLEVLRCLAQTFCGRQGRLLHQVRPLLRPKSRSL